MKKKKALLFYISRFSGHFHGARAIERSLHAICDQIDTKVINAIEYTNPILGKLLNRTYLEVIKKKPEFWGQIYDNPDVLKKIKKTREAVHRYNMPKIKKLLEREDPDVVICTQAFPCGMVADYKKTFGNNVRLIGVLTDYAPHSYWLYDEVDYYVVPSEEVAKALQQKGIPQEKVKAYGIPVDPKFSLRHDTCRTKKELGLLEDDPTILIMGGSQGIGAMDEVAKSLLKEEKHNYQLVILTGTNKRLYKKLIKINRRKQGCMKVLPYVENIDELMEMSDVIITKAGGLTTAEALVKKLPMLIVDPIPGHERMNTDYLVGEGVAIEFDDFTKIHDCINRLFETKNVLDEMKAKSERLSKPESSLDIAKMALEKL